MAEILTFDMSVVMMGKIQQAPFEQALNKIDWKKYQGRDVKIKGCGPVWAYLLVNNRLREVAAEINYEEFDGKLVTVFKR